VNEIISASLYLMVATLAYACFYIAEKLKQALIPFLIFGSLLCLRFFRYKFFSSVILFPYLPDWFYPDAIIAYMIGGGLGSIYFLREQARIKQTEAKYDHRE
jgi:hypothetical protein